MAKVKKKKKKRSGVLMGRSDIPYAQRLTMQRNDDIAAIRGHAAKIAVLCMSVAMNELEGIGYKRLVRFSLKFKEVVDDFYECPELGMAHARHRMAQFGMPISGEFYSVKVPGLSPRAQELHDHSLQAAQISLICGAIAMNEVFGFGQERQTRVSDRAYELSERYNKEGEKFLLDAMEKIGFPIVNGEVLAFVDDEMQAVHPKQAEVMK